MYPHIPVLLNEVLEYLEPGRGGAYLDGTVGLGGHSEAILNAGPSGLSGSSGKIRLIGLDKDTRALETARKRLAPFNESVHLENTAFSNFATVLEKFAPDGIDGALLDLGVSSIQLDSPERGFSFMHDGPLDMRMGAEGELAKSTESALELIESTSFEELRRIIAEYGEEPMAAPIARAIIAARNEGIESTLQLAKIVEQAYPPKWRAKARRHPATRTFQALRMAVNQELDELKTFLELIPSWLKPGGRLVIISFHSLEDRMVKQAFRDGSATCVCPKSLPQCICEIKPVYRVITKRPVTPGDEELSFNPRAGSSKLRAAERI